jgi:hypothetical protein
MPQPETPTTPTCALCGDAFTPSRYTQEGYCGRRCEFRATWTDPAQHAADLEALSVEFVAAVLIDSGYVETMLSEASVMLARQGRLPARDELRAFEGSGLYLAPAVSSAR